MFAVPGWSVAPDKLKTQTAPESEATPKKVKTANGESPSSASKKRKRGGKVINGTTVTKDNLSELWDKHVVGTVGVKKVPGENDAIGKKGRKRRKHDEESTPGGALVEDVAAVNGNEVLIEIANGKEHSKDAYAERKSKKDKKKEAKAALEATGELPPPRPTATETKVDKDAAPKVPSAPPSKQKDPAQKAPKTAPPAPSQQPKPAPSLPPAVPPPLPPSTKLTPLQTAMRQKLVSARFRHLNQQLYTSPSASAQALFSTNPTFFTEYHDGFARQVTAWPENPASTFSKWVLARGSVKTGREREALGEQRAAFRKSGAKGGGKKGAKKNTKGDGSSAGGRENASSEEMTTEAVEAAKKDLGSTTTTDLEALPRSNRPPQTCTIADLGCGMAQLASLLAPHSKTLGVEMKSFDLHAANEHITVADISSLPLADGSVDVAIFCLALMGTNWLDFIEEAWRVLRWKGECWIAEVGSRFVGSGGGAKAESKEVVEHSLSNRQRKKQADMKKKKKGGNRDADGNREDEILLSDEEGNELSTAAAAVPGKDSNALQALASLRPFVVILRSRGFALVGEPEVGNKMFVRMRFTKSITPIRGKGVRNVEGGGGQAKPKFLDKKGKDEDSELPAEEDEGKVLKPCVYKNR
ncbi:25S rRNA (adenine645-N1)-methyltransferase [Agyrium rufum]|nr:25S rRNA (adenine645-N1)-methyltransferase [Agyrium rufum]